MKSWRLPTSSVRPLSIGSDDGWAWRSIKPGMTIEPRPSISSASDRGGTVPTAVIVAPVKARSMFRR
jgi:hypothetical protein